MNKLEKTIKSEESNLSPSLDTKARVLMRAKIAMENKEEAPVKKGFRLNLRIFIPILTCLIFLVAGLSTYIGFRFEKYETVYIDVNPSVNLTLNRFETVVAYELVNEDSQEIFNDVNFKNKKLDESVDIILDRLNDCDKLDNAYVNYNAISKSEEKTQKLLDFVNKKIEDAKEKYNVSFDFGGEEVTDEDVEASIEIGINPGKLKIILQIQGLDPTQKLEDLKDMTMADLIELLRKLIRG